MTIKMAKLVTQQLHRERLVAHQPDRVAADRAEAAVVAEARQRGWLHWELRPQRLQVVATAALR